MFWLTIHLQLGLAAVPALPYMFDEPVEYAVEWGFWHAFRAIGGEQAVGNRPVTGRSHQLVKENRVAEAIKEKEKQS
jgi:mitochondrial fission process protein 1